MPINTNTNGEGKYAIPVKYMAEVQRLIAEYGVARKVFKTVNTDMQSGYMAQITALPTIYYPDEGDAATASLPTFGQKTFAVKRFAALVEMNIDWLEDTFATEKETVIDTMLEALAKDEDRCVFLGDGTATYNSITGLTNIVLTAYPKNIIDMGHSDFSYEKLLEGQAVISEQKGMASALVVSPRGLKSLALVTDGAGRYMFKPYDSMTAVNGAAVGLVNGTVPVYVSQALVDYETANSNGIAFMVDGAKMANIVLRYNEVKFKKEEVQKQWRFAYSIMTRMDFVSLFPQLLVRFENLAI